MKLNKFGTFIENPSQLSPEGAIGVRENLKLSNIESHITLFDSLFESNGNNSLLFANNSASKVTFPIRPFQ